MALLGFEILLFVLCISVSIGCVFGIACLVKMAIDFIRGKI